MNNRHIGILLRDVLLESLAKFRRIQGCNWGNSHSVACSAIQSPSLTLTCWAIALVIFSS